MIDFLLRKAPFGVIVFDRKMDIIYSNDQGKLFIQKYGQPPELVSITQKIFDSIEAGNLKEKFSGEIFLAKKLGASSNKWTFKFDIFLNDQPFVCIYIREDSILDKMELNKLRAQFRLTRREIDVLRRTFAGLKNTEVAQELGITEQTVKDYLSSVYAKFGVKNKFGLVSSIFNISDQGGG